MKIPFENVNPKRCGGCQTIIDVDFKDIKNGNIAVCPICKYEQNIKDMRSVPSVDKNTAEARCYNIVAMMVKEENETMRQS